MRFTKISEIVTATNTLPKTAGGTRTTYPVLFKKAVCEYIERTNTTAHKLSKSVQMTAALLGKWLIQYNDGLYTMEGVYNVSKTSLKSNTKILAQLNNEVNLLQRKIELVKECQKLGIQVALPEG